MSQLTFSIIDRFLASDLFRRLQHHPSLPPECKIDGGTPRLLLVLRPALKSAVNDPLESDNGVKNNNRLREHWIESFSGMGSLFAALVFLFSVVSSAVSCWTAPPQHDFSTSCAVRRRDCRNQRMETSMLPKNQQEETSTAQSSVGRVRILGVCGGIGSGKSAACKILVSELNCLAHIDSDSIAHTVYEKGSDAVTDVVAEFGSDLIDSSSGEIDRGKLGAIVFADIQDMQKLERIVWPHVQAKIAAQIEQAKKDWDDKSSGKTPVIVVEAAVLLDAGWQEFLDGVWVVRVPTTEAVERLQANRGISVEDAERRIEAQQPRRGIGNLQEEMENDVVTAVIDNRGSLEDLKQRLKEKLDDPTAWYRQSSNGA